MGRKKKDNKGTRANDQEVSESPTSKPSITDDSLREQISSLWNEKKHAEALEVLDSIQTKDHRDFTNRACLLWNLDRKPEALEALQTSLFLKETARGHYLTALILVSGRSRYSLGKDLETTVVTHLEKAVALPNCPEHAFLYLDDLSKTYDEEGTKKQRSLLTGALERHPDSEKIRLRLASLHLWHLQSPTDALKTLSPLLTASASPAEALWLASRAAEKLGDLQQALAYLKQTQPYRPNGVGIAKVLGDLHYRLGDTAAAIQHLNQEIASPNAEARIVGLFSRAELALSSGDVASAITDARNAAMVAFDAGIFSFIPGRVSLSETYEGYYDYANTVSLVCNTLLTGAHLDTIKNDPTLCGRLCFILYKMCEGDADSEERWTRWLQKAASFDNHPAYSEELSRYYAAQGDYVASVEHHLRYCKWTLQQSNPSNKKRRPSFASYYSLDKVTLSKKQTKVIHDLALTALRETQDPEELRAIFVPFYSSTWSKLLQAAQMHKESLEISHRLVQIAPNNSDLLWTHAYGAHCAGETNEAFDNYLKYLELNPKGASAYHNLSILLESKGQLDDAIKFQELAFQLSPNGENIKKRHESFEKIRAFKRAAENSLMHPAAFEKLSLKERLYLGALLRCCLTEDRKEIIPVESATAKLGPHEDHEKNILQTLWDANLIVVDPSSKQEALFLKDGQISVYIRQVKWILNVKSSIGLSRDEICNRLCEPTEPLDHEIDDAIELWKELSLEESIEYLQYKRRTVDLNAPIGDKTRDYFKDLLQRYSTAQMYNIIWNAIRNAVTYQKVQGLSNSHAANLVVSNCKSYGERAYGERWDLKPYRRNYDCEESVLSQLFFHRVLRIGEAGFSQRPGSFAGLRFNISSDRSSQSDASIEGQTAE